MFSWLVILLITVLGIMASATDINEGKIKNKHLIAVALFFSAIVGVKIIIDVISGRYLFSWFVFTFANLVLALVFGFLLWQLGFWTAGDAKLYSVFSMMIASLFARPQSLIDFPFISLIIFSFAPFFIYFAAKVVFSIRLKNIISSGKDSLSLKSISLPALSMFVILWPLELLKNDSRYAFLIMVVLIGATITIEKTMGRASAYILSALAIARLVFDRKVYSWNYIAIFVMLVFVFIIVRKLLFYQGYYAFTKDIRIKSLRRKMILAEEIREIKGRYVKEKVSALNIFSGKTIKTGDHKDTRKGKSQDYSIKDISMIIRLYKQKKLDFDSIRIYDTLPFAPFMFAGAILVLILNHI
ncbi:hypothetical protein JXB31_03340 [Candidatus Woesearchaeota archaeon]|nr:hypothetical protein [Candidatus Woesearchaeota archaeon]